MQSRNRLNPSAQVLLVPLNLVLAFCAVLPSLAMKSLPFLFASMQILGAFPMITGFFFLLMLSEIGKAGVLVCAAVLIPAAILLPWMLLARRIPWWVRLLTASLELPAFWLMYNTVEKLHLEYLRGGFKDLML
jgi:hypothetical protein